VNRFVELSHPIEDGMVTYPGFPPPAITDHVSREASRARYAPGTEFHFGHINMVANTGTYLDAPSHRFADGIDIADLPLARLAALRGVVVDRPGTVRAIPAVTLDGVDVTGRAVLFRTGWDRHWRTEAYGVDHPYLTDACATTLVERGAALVGIDSLNIDDTATGERPIHTALLGAGIPIVEHLCGLDALDGAFTFFAVPAPVRGIGSFPVRAFALSAD
jgi:arylformamidase